MEYHLSSDITSQFNRKEIYGYKGEKVTLISDRGNIWIMENKNGQRFPVNAELISQTIVEAGDSITTKEEQAPPPPPVKKKAAGKKVKNDNQQSFF